MIIRARAAYTPRMLGAGGICTVNLPCTYCVMCARRWHGDFFLTCSKFDGTHCACGVCLAHRGDSTAYVWRTHSVNEDPWAYVAYLPRICYFFVRRASAVASPASGTGALNGISLDFLFITTVMQCCLNGTDLHILIRALKYSVV